MTTDAWITLVVLVGTFGLLTRDRFSPTLVMLGSLTTLVLADVIDVATGFAGFGAEAPLTVAALYVLAAGARRTGLLAPITGRLLTGDGGATTVLRLGAPVAAMSTLFNNTPLVAMLIPEVQAWCRRTGLSPSRLLMPLSFAAILGGVVTVIGTSTNLVVAGVVADLDGEPLGFFELTPVGLPVAVIGLLMLGPVAARLLPERADPASDAQASVRDYAMHLTVALDGPLAGRTLSDAGLRNLRGVYVADILRGDRRIGPVGGDEVLEGGDLLVFVGDADGVIDLRQRPGLEAPGEQSEVLRGAQSPRYYDVVIGRGSPLVGATLKEIGGRGGYRAAAVAIHRAGEAVRGKLGEVELRPGDMLVVFAQGDLRSSRRATEDFLLISPLDDAVPVIRSAARWVALSLLVFAGTASTGLLSTLEAALVAAALLVVTRTVTFTEAKRAVDLDVVILVAASLGLGRAVELSGLAALAAELATVALGGLGVVGIVLAIHLTTTVLTEVVTNNAAAAVIAPVAFRTAEAVGLDPRVAAVGVAVMASASFLTPIGYQTNAMVLGPGGYRFADFARVGGPLNLAVLATTTTAVVLLG